MLYSFLFKGSIKNTANHIMNINASIILQKINVFTDIAKRNTKIETLTIREILKCI